MKKGIRCHDILENDLYNIARSARENDIEYLQLILEKSVPDFEVGKFSEEYAQSLKQALGESKLAILGSYINPSNPDDGELAKELDKFKEKIRYASILNPIAVGTETGIFKVGMTDSEAAYERVLSSMRELVAYAEKYNVCIAIEGVHCFVINTPQKLKRLVDDLDSDNVRVIFDIGGYLTPDTYMNQDQIINDMFDLLADKICALHIKDYVIENSKFKGVIPTQGIINYKLIADKLVEHGLDVPLISEERGIADAVIGLESINKLMEDKS